MNRAEHLKQHEDRAGKRERTGERIAALHGADEHAHRDRERRRQDPSQQEGRPPSGGEARVRLRQDGEELPFLALGQWLEHDRILPQNRCRLVLHSWRKASIGSTRVARCAGMEQANNSAAISTTSRESEGERIERTHLKQLAAQ